MPGKTRIFIDCENSEMEPNEHLRRILISSMSKDSNNEQTVQSTTELDSHANMVVMGKNCVILEDTGAVVDVKPFTPDYKPTTNAKIVDAAVRHVCEYTGVERVLVFRNCIHFPSMNHNLVPPFIMREKGIIVNDIPKIHLDDPSVEDHSIYIKKYDVRIPLKLKGIFSYFETSIPSEELLSNTDEIYDMTPVKWNPHCESYAENEESMLDWEGNMKEPQHRKKILLSEIDPDKDLEESLNVSSVENTHIDSLSESAAGGWCPETCVPVEADEVKLHLSDVSPLLDAEVMSVLVNERINTGNFMASIGSTNVEQHPHLIPEEDDHTIESIDDQSTSSNESMDSAEHIINLTKDRLPEEVFEAHVDLEDILVSAVGSQGKPSVDAKTLGKLWRIDLEAAKRTIEITTQRQKRTKDPKLSRNYGTGDRMLRYKRINEYFYMDTFYATAKGSKSLRQNTCCQLFVTDKGYVYVVPMKAEKQVIHAVKQFAKEIGAPDAIICDAAKAQTKDELKQFLNNIGTSLKTLEEGTPWANRAELYIGLIKEAVRKDMKESNSPLRLWDYCVERRAAINNLTAKNLFQLHSSNAHTSLTGTEGDISNLCTFKWYDWCYFRDQRTSFPESKEVLGRVLGPARGEGNSMCQWILKSNGRVVPRRSARPLHDDEWVSETEIAKRKLFDKLIGRRLGDPAFTTKTETNAELFEEYSSEEETARIVSDIEDAVDHVGNSINLQPAYDKMINLEIHANHDGQQQVGRVVGRTLGSDGRTVGRYHEKPIMNSMLYDVEFPDGQVKEYAANIISENILSQVDSEGFTTSHLESIVDYRVNDSAVPKSRGFITSGNGQRKRRKTTKGWELLVRWINKEETWVPLKDL